VRENETPPRSLNHSLTCGAKYIKKKNEAIDSRQQPNDVTGK